MPGACDALLADIEQAGAHVHGMPASLCGLATSNVDTLCTSANLIEPVAAWGKGSATAVDTGLTCGGATPGAHKGCLGAWDVTDCCR